MFGYLYSCQNRSTSHFRKSVSRQNREQRRRSRRVRRAPPQWRPLSKIPKHPRSRQLFAASVGPLTPPEPPPPCAPLGCHGRDRIRAPMELPAVRPDQPHGEGQVQPVLRGQEGRRPRGAARSILRGLHRRQEAQVEGRAGKSAAEAF